MENRDAALQLQRDLRAGLTAEFEREIHEQDVLEFARNSGDNNPLHVDENYARSTNFSARIVHGAFQIALASTMAGMYLPGTNVLLVSCNAQFNRPLYFPCRVSVKGEITAWDPGKERGNLRVLIVELPTGIVSSKIHFGFTLHESVQGTVRPVRKEVSPIPFADAKVVLVTGASGGIGSQIVSELAGDYSLLALTNRHDVAPEVASHPSVFHFKGDLSEPACISGIEDMITGRRLFGIIHAAWPGLPQGGLLSMPPQAIEQQLSFAVFRTIDLARMLANSADSDGGRLIVLGSIAGTQKPSLKTAAYSLAKAALDQTVRLLAPELALKKITVNAVCPSFLPIGMNLQTTDRQKLAVKATVPLGRLCEIADIVAAVRYLLSKEASFVTGQSIVLSGGQL